ncbi:unnamed protein product [Bemisia tabaci]|uniref:ODAD1 central coiled coil region domain-containing protein n=1 Tax=Bemisia tabaci TaxID=7038 RepID=A0A9P0A770_BEMTA|nr:PREDICTED: coiled-coil domain-containing protein 63 [Bemisia tabaci]CAH0385664.1 unnamed protein product [Bemisia tabaci]
MCTKPHYKTGPTVTMAPEDLEMYQLARAELDRLERQYRIMESDRLSYAEEMKIHLNKQRRMIENLQREKDEITTNLNVGKTSQNILTNNQQNEKLKELIKRHDDLEAMIKVEKSQLEELDSQIFKIEKEVDELRLKDSSTIDRRLESKMKDSARHIALLENRLHVATMKFDKNLMQNAVLKEEINTALKQRSRFNEVYQNLVRRLETGKQVMLNLIEQATLAFDQREEAQSKLKALQDRDRQDLLKHSHELRELQRRLDYDTKLEEFLGTKGQYRIMADLQTKEAEKQRKQKEEAAQQIKTNLMILDQIKTFSSESDIDRLAAQFIKQEEENFALFNYVNELNNELEALQEQVNNLVQSIEEQRVINKERATQQEETIASLTQNLDDKTAEADTMNENLRATTDRMTQLLRGIDSLFKLIPSDSTAILKLLGESPTVQPFNVMLFLNIIERRIIEIVNKVYVLEKQAQFHDEPSLLVMKEEVPSFRSKQRESQRISGTPPT